MQDTCSSESVHSASDWKSVINELFWSVESVSKVAEFLQTLLMCPSFQVFQGTGVNYSFAFKLYCVVIKGIHNSTDSFKICLKINDAEEV